MRFGEYIRACREKSHMTQEELVHALYLFDDALFQGLDTTTMSKWERGITQPKAAKQLQILHFFQQKQHKILPCFDDHSVLNNETLLCKKGVENLIRGKRKELVLSFTGEMMTLENLSIIQARHLENMETFLEVASDIRNSVQPSYTYISAEQMKNWAPHPSHLFFVCRYKGFVIGFLFVLRVKPEVQQEVLHFKKAFSQLKEEDFASYEEPGAHLTTHFYAWNRRSATLLIIRYYAHLIANQHNIVGAGATVYYEEGAEILENMNLRMCDRFEEDGITLHAYCEKLENILLTENVMRMLFTKEDCPEE